MSRLRRNRLLGTPNEETWPGVSQLPDYKPTFPQWAPVDLARAVPALDAHGIDLLRVRVRASPDAEKKADLVATLHDSKPSSTILPTDFPVSRGTFHSHPAADHRSLLAQQPSEHSSTTTSAHIKTARATPREAVQSASAAASAQHNLCPGATHIGPDHRPSRTLGCRFTHFASTERPICIIFLLIQLYYPHDTCIRRLVAASKPSYKGSDHRHRKLLRRPPHTSSRTSAHHSQIHRA